MTARVRAHAWAAISVLFENGCGQVCGRRSARASRALEKARDTCPHRGLNGREAAAERRETGRWTTWNEFRSLMTATVRASHRPLCAASAISPEEKTKGATGDHRALQGFSGGGMEKPQLRPCRLNGRTSTVLPVPHRTAFATAGPTGGVPGSPAPVGASADGTMWVSTTGMSDIRSGS